MTTKYWEIVRLRLLHLICVERSTGALKRNNPLYMLVFRALDRAEWLIGIEAGLFKNNLDFYVIGGFSLHRSHLLS